MTTNRGVSINPIPWPLWPSLRATLVTDAAACGLLGIIALAGAGWLSDQLALSEGWLRILGVGLIGAAVVVASALRQPFPSRRLILLIMALNAGWLIACIAWLIVRWPSLFVAGVWVIFVQVTVVALLVLRYAAELTRRSFTA